jgi:cation/acetate symporter
MATQTSGESDFVSNLGRIYGIYTGGFVAFVILLAILEQVGVPNRVIGYLFVFFTLAVYALIGVMSRTMQISEYYVAGRHAVVDRRHAVPARL